MKKAKVHQLKLETEDISVIGISSGFADYRLAWELNQKLNFKLFLSDETFTTNEARKSELTHFRLYHFFDEEENRAYYLLRNKQASKVAVQELSQMDFFLITTPLNKASVEELMKNIREINGVAAVFNLSDTASTHFEQISL